MYITGVIECQRDDSVLITASEVGGVVESRTLSVQLDHKAVTHAVIRWLKGADRGEVIRIGLSGNVGIAVQVHGDSVAQIHAGAAQVRGIG